MTSCPSVKNHAPHGLALVGAQGNTMELAEPAEEAPASSLTVPTLRAPNGSAVGLEGDRFVHREPNGVVTFELDTRTGTLRILAPNGDLSLAAPNGRVLIESGTDVVMEASRDVIQRAGRRLASSVVEGGSQLELTSQRLEARTRWLDIAAHRATLVSELSEVTARQIAQTADEIRSAVGRWELRAERIVEKAGNVFRDAEGVVQTRAQRIRSVARDTLQVFGRRVSLQAKEDASVDGRRVRLG